MSMASDAGLGRRRAREAAARGFPPESRPWARNDLGDRRVAVQDGDRLAPPYGPQVLAQTRFKIGDTTRFIG